MDDSATFQSAALKEMLEKWGMRHYFQAAYRLSGNGVVNRHHWTIHAVAYRNQILPQEAVFWYVTQNGPGCRLCSAEISLQI